MHILSNNSKHWFWSPIWPGKRMNSPKLKDINIRTDWKPYPLLQVLMSKSLVNAVLCHAFCLNKKRPFRDASSCLLFV